MEWMLEVRGGCEGGCVGFQGCIEGCSCCVYVL